MPVPAAPKAEEESQRRGEEEQGGGAATFIVLRGCITVCMENTPNWKHQLPHVLSECRNTSEQWSFIFHTSISQESHIGKKDNLKT